MELKGVDQPLIMFHLSKIKKRRSDRLSNYGTEGSRWPYYGQAGILCLHRHHFSVGKHICFRVGGRCAVPGCFCGAIFIPTAANNQYTQRLLWRYKHSSCEWFIITSIYTSLNIHSFHPAGNKLADSVLVALIWSRRYAPPLGRSLRVESYWTSTH